MFDSKFRQNLGDVLVDKRNVLKGEKKIWEQVIKQRKTI